MKLALRNSVPLLFVAWLQASAAAHPGHGDPGPAHYVTAPEHAIVIVAVVGLLTIVAAVFAKTIGLRSPRFRSRS